MANDEQPQDVTPSRLEAPSGTVTMSHEQVREIAREAASEVLAQLGFDAADRKEIYADALWLRKQRLGAEQFQAWIKRGAITAFVSGGLYAVWIGIKELAKIKGGP